MLKNKNFELKIRASYGTLGLLGLKHIKMQAKPTTLYLMINERCLYGCGYCPQARSSKSTSHEKLSRVIWPELEWETFKEAMAERQNLYQRICFQVINGKDYLGNTLFFLKDLKSLNLKKPVSISIRVKKIEEVERLFEAGADRIGLPLDVASKKLFTSIRGGDFDEAKKLIIEAASKYKGLITTHIIVGLGETDKEIYELMKEFCDSHILVSLFAFTPVNGTLLENKRPPGIYRYRRIQLLRFLLTNEIKFAAEFDDSGNLLHIELDNTDVISSPLIYITSGCPGCNRPYYNETPTGVMYNFPFMPEVNGSILDSYIENVKGRRITFKKD